MVLWMLLLLSLLAASFVSTSRADLEIARNDVESARARALADAGVARAVLALGVNDPAARWHADGTLYRWAFGGGAITVAIVGEGGKIDLNAAPPEMLASLFRRLGAGDELSQRLTQEALDRRAARLAAQPVLDPSTPVIEPNAPAFAAIEDLGQLAGMTAPLLHAALPLVTVLSQRPTVDPTVAPREVLLALPGADAAEIDAFLADRARQAQGAPVAAAPPASVANYLAPGAVPAVTVRAAAATDTGARFVREALVVLRDPQGAPFVARSWAQGLAAE
jgi:general secretion pathway protein K